MSYIRAYCIVDIEVCQYLLGTYCDVEDPFTLGLVLHFSEKKNEYIFMTL